MASPSSSPLFVRAANLGLGLGFPVYLTFKALEKKSQGEQEQWLIYWAVYGCFNFLERMSDKIISWFPFYHHAKFLLLAWLQLPHNYGVKFVYFNYLRPFLLKHQSTLDRIIGSIRNELDNFLTSHYKEILDAASFTRRHVLSAYRITVRSTQTPGESGTTSDVSVSGPVVTEVTIVREDDPCRE